MAADAVCDNCTKFVTTVANFIQTNESIKMATDFFNGTDFCGAAKPPIPKSDCQTFNQWFTPASMSVLGQVMNLSPKAVCQLGYGACK